MSLRAGGLIRAARLLIVCLILFFPKAFLLPIDAFFQKPEVGFAGRKTLRTFFAVPSRAGRSLHRRNARVGASAESLDVDADLGASAADDVEGTRSTTWAKRALFISSFSDGVVSSPAARDFLRWGLASSLAATVVREREEAVRDSVMFSPCAGPDIEALNRLEEADRAAGSSGGDRDGDDDDEGDERDYGALADLMLDNVLAADCSNDGVDPMQCRVLYVPTAMYALSSGSKNTPGKQRQRARADGKKRRDLVVKAVDELLNKNKGDGKWRRKVDVLACTLDLYDSSIKQPVGSDDPSIFPADGREALGPWNPHLLYVEGGNTFWLAHCVEKGGWEEDLRRAVAADNEAAAVYVGKSAGAILAGARVETATWKGWDDPSIVNERPTYDDWIGLRGLCLAGETASFFPHMADDWGELVEEKKGPLEADGNGQVFCLQEWEACCVDGDRQQISFIVGEQ